jgi:hypothetical protein
MQLAHEPESEPNSDILDTLTQNLTHATTILRLTQSNLNQFLQHLESSFLPMCYWPITQLKRFSLLQKQNSQALRDFNQARQSTITKPSESKSKPPEPPPPPPKPPIEKTLFQNIKVEVIDGKTVSTISPPAAFMVDKQISQHLDVVFRQFYFVNCIIPEEYAYILTHDGVAQEPTEYFRLSYTANELERISKLELNTRSQHALDGPRNSYRRVELRDN